jgi:DNA-binding ferritin-like protein
MRYIMELYEAAKDTATEGLIKKQVVPIDWRLWMRKLTLESG